MAFAFDTLGYSKRLREAGLALPQAEAHAEAAREFIMAELVTRADLDVAVTPVRHEMTTMRRELEAAIDRVSLQLTIRLGGMLAVAVAVLAAIMKL